MLQRVTHKETGNRKVVVLGRILGGFLGKNLGKFIGEFVLKTWLWSQLWVMIVIESTPRGEKAVHEW